jgi:hypothetical protein
VRRESAGRTCIGRKLTTLRDAGNYVATLPTAKQKRPEWQLAAEMSLNAAKRGGIVMFAEIGMKQALNAT